MTTKASDLAQALQRKGFAPEGGDHDWYYLHVGGRKTDVRTKISHGERDINPSLESKIRRQMGALRPDEFRNFVRCPMTREQYVKLLHDVGVLPGPQGRPVPVWERRRAQ